MGNRPWLVTCNVCHSFKWANEISIEKSLKKWYNIYYVKDFQGGRTMSKKHEAGKIFVKVMAALLAALMVLAVSATLIFYIINK